MSLAPAFIYCFLTQENEFFSHRVLIAGYFANYLFSNYFLVDVFVMMEIVILWYNHK